LENHSVSCGVFCVFLTHFAGRHTAISFDAFMSMRKGLAHAVVFDVVVCNMARLALFSAF